MKTNEPIRRALCLLMAGQNRRKMIIPPVGEIYSALLDPSGKIESRKVVLGIQTATDAEVISGLQEGDTVVVSDRSGLKAGQPVQPKMIDLMQYRSTEEQH